MIEVIPLGGLGQFGMNCMSVRYGDEMIILDAGMGFPDEKVYGVDVAIPDFAFLEEYRDNITAIILTHGHEDHIGALPYILKQFNVPVYASHFTAALAERKLEEHNLLGDVLLHRVEPRQVVELGSFTIEFIRASHSLVDCFSIAIKTPAGTIIHTGDYKVDETPMIGEPIDLRTLRRYGKEGVLALLSDSTNSIVTGRTPSERAVIPAFEEVFAAATGRIIVATFSSSIHRIQIVLDIAHQFNRKVCVVGRSMQKNVEIAQQLGYLDISDGTLVPLNEAKHLRDCEIVFLVTGSQGEPRAALTQMAAQSFKGFTVNDGDTVILSARMIAGNELAISRLVGNIYKRGGNIIDEKRRLIHVSGHASQEDIRIMTEAVRPKYIVPIHGEFRMMYRHKEFAKNHLGYADENVILIENGSVLQLSEDGWVVVEKREVGRTFIDDSGFEEIEPETVSQRREMASAGIVTPIVTFNLKTGEMQGLPRIVTYGLIGPEDSKWLLEEMQEVVKNAVVGATDLERGKTTLLKDRIRFELKCFVQNRLGTDPIITPVVVQI